jgi:hypothetical protein
LVSRFSVPRGFIPLGSTTFPSGSIHPVKNFIAQHQGIGNLLIFPDPDADAASTECSATMTGPRDETAFQFLDIAGRP